jgi:hypothetical protein
VVWELVLVDGIKFLFLEKRFFSDCMDGSLEKELDESPKYIVTRISLGKYEYQKFVI